MEQLGTTPRTKMWWVIGALGVGAMLALVIWYGVATQVGAVRPQVVGYHVQDDTLTEVTYQVNRPEGRGLSCVITALDERHGRVGTAQDAVPAGEGWVRRTVTVRTTHRAVTGIVDSCTRVN